jgi:ATP-dependent Lhr-like helicase
MTNLPASSSEPFRSSNFGRLHPKIQKWIWDAGWSELRDAQEQAIPVILEGERDVLIAASTASGKTEAAFLPILTALLQGEERSAVLYISPLKALINDQWGRLEGLCEQIDIPVIPWHGDVSDTRKKRFLKTSEGVLLITPESLEALLMNRGHGLAGLFGGLRYIVVDELHAFIGTERGRQLQSLMHRVETVVKRPIPRIGLSATLGDMGLAAEFLRTGGGAALIESRESGQELKVLVKGYLSRPPVLSAKEIQALEKAGEAVAFGDTVDGAVKAIGDHLYKTLRGANHLVFPNSRGQVEVYSDLLRERCEQDGVPNEFWPHHGSLSKEIREDAEAALKSRERPATAVCTTTLELGIDIGAVKSIVQIGAAPSVASLRQRLGRSGRRKGEPAILRAYVVEDEITPQTPLADQLRHHLVMTVAQIRLLIDGWYEPPRPAGLHLSTLVQQLLSALAQYGGLTAKDAWTLLCAGGPFQNLSQREFADLLRGLAEREVLIQDPRGLLLQGPIGERISGHYSFYAAFVSDDEFRLVSGNRTLGSIPVSRPLEPGSYLIFAGRRWRVLRLDDEKRVIELAPDHAGKAPLFDGMGAKVHDRVREEMRSVLTDQQPVPFLDRPAQELLDEAKLGFRRLDLSKSFIVEQGNELCLFVWKGDWIQDTIALLFSVRKFEATNCGLYIAIRGLSAAELPIVCKDIVEAPIDEESIVSHVDNQMQEKWDFLLPPSWLARNYASQQMDISGAFETIRRLVDNSR